jgi:hypothetical protein
LNAPNARMATGILTAAEAGVSLGENGELLRRDRDDGVETDLDPLGQFILDRIVRDPRSTQKIPREILRNRDWAKRVILAAIRRNRKVFEYADPFVGDQDVRHIAQAGPVSTAEDANRLYRMVGYQPPPTEELVPGSPLDQSAIAIREWDMKELLDKRFDVCDVCGKTEVREGTISLLVRGVETIRTRIGRCSYPAVHSVERDRHAPPYVYKGDFVPST